MKLELQPDTSACRLCGSTVHQCEFWREHFMDSGQTLRRCGHCGGVYLAPDFTKRALKEFYCHIYSKLFLFYDADSPKGNADRFFRQKGDDYYASLRFFLLAPFLPKDGGLFEIGSGSGAFLGVVSRNRPDIRLYGCEPNEAVRRQRLGGASVRFLAWGEHPDPNEGIDLISVFHTLEHVQDVVGFLDQSMVTLRPGGHLVIEVPDVLSGWSHRHFVHPAHLTYFTADSLRRVLQAVGFEIVTCGAHPAAGYLREHIWALARKPKGESVKAPIEAASAEEIAALDRKISSVAWTWSDSCKQAFKRLAKRVLPSKLWKRLKLRKHYSQRIQMRCDNFPLFEFTLRTVYGQEAARVRHEAFYLSMRTSRARQKLRATLALMRDIVWCAALPRHLPSLSPLICCVSLARFQNVLSAVTTRQASDAPVTIIARHDQRRAVPNAISLAAPHAAGWRKALSALTNKLPPTASVDALEPWTLRCCIARHRLWTAAWERTLVAAPAGATLLLHNDFDMFSRAGVEAARTLNLRSVCVQHGLPTDEFFPTSADTQLVWGKSSAEVYAKRGTLTSAIFIGTPLASNEGEAHTGASPSRILLISQTHTPVYGAAMPRELTKLARELAQRAGANTFEILLHPAEAQNGHPFNDPAIRNLCRLPPHTSLNNTKDPTLIVGFCSTALIDAARAGHYVAGLDWPASASQGATMVGIPKRRVKNAKEVLDQFERLRADATLREGWLTEQRRWLDETFAPLASHWLEEAAGV